MLRTVNVVVEIFIDVEEDGTAYAEALMLRNADKCLLAQGFACLEPEDSNVNPTDDGQIAARALVDLTDTLMCGAGEGRGQITGGQPLNAAIPHLPRASP